MRSLLTVLLLIFLVSCIEPIVPEGDIVRGEGLRGSYFDSTSGELLTSRIDPSIDFSWGYEAPLTDAPKDYFSVIWDGELRVPASGSYVFTVRVDDGARLFIDGVNILSNDAWRNQPPSVYSAAIVLEEGKHPIRLEYYEAHSHASVQLNWSGMHIDDGVIPPEFLYPAQLPASYPPKGAVQDPAADPPEQVRVVRVGASGHDGNVPQNALDGDRMTRWSSYGVGEHLELEFDRSYALRDIGIAWYKGDSRSAEFSIEVYDGSWSEVFRGATTELTLDHQMVVIGRDASRLRITGYGNTDADPEYRLWTSITNIRLNDQDAIFDPQVDGPAPNDPPEGSAPDGRIVLGPRPVPSTPLSQGTRFASPSGSGSACSIGSPCTLSTAISGARAGDVVFLRAGTYALHDAFRVRASGTASEPITIESYPGERAVIDGGYRANTRFSILSDHIVVRNLDVTGMMVGGGIYIGGNHNLIEGVHSYRNVASGFMISHMSYPPAGAEPPYYTERGSFNTIRDCIAHSNSDVDTAAQGDNADGIAVPSGDGNVVRNCLVYNNSDDGIDSWRSTNTLIAFNIVHSNGYGPRGNGNGVKAGGTWPSYGTIVMHSISYNNRNVGFTQNSGEGVKMYYVTSWNNGRSFWTETSSDKPRDAIIERSIAAGSGTHLSFGGGTMIDNSWQRSGSLSFVSTDPSSSDFLRPTPGSGFEDIGAYAPSIYAEHERAPFP